MAMVRDHEAASKGKALTIVSPGVHTRSPGGLGIGSNQLIMFSTFALILYVGGELVLEERRVCVPGVDLCAPW